jgi:hypothetical protein
MSKNTKGINAMGNSITRLAAPLRAALVLAALTVIAVPAAADAANGFNVGTPFSGPGAGAGQLANPQRAAIEASTGNLLVADQGNDRIDIFKTSTNGALTSFGSAATINDPYGIAVNPTTGSVYVASLGSNAITKWDTDGAPTPTYTQDLTFTSPAANGDPVAPGELGTFAVPLAVDPTTGDLLVADTSDNKIQRYNANGTFDSEFDGTARPDAAAFSRLLDIATDATGDLYVIDGARIDRFNADDSFDAAYMSQPGAGLIAVDPVSNDPVVVTDVDNFIFRDEQLVAYDGLSVASTNPVPPADDSLVFPGGLAFTASGSLYVVTRPGYGGEFGGTTTEILPLARSLVLPDATTVAATNVTETTARLRGTIDAPSDVTFQFEYSTDQGVSWAQTPEQGPIDGTTPVLANVTGLADGTSYLYRLAIKQGAAMRYSAPLTLTTIDGDVPAATLDAASGLTTSGATLNGTVNPNGLPTTVRFEISGDGGGSFMALPGPDGDPGTDDAIGSGSTGVAVSGATPSLEPNRAYPIRLSATNVIGTTPVDGTVTTLPEQAIVSEPSVAAVKATSVELKGTVNTRNADTTYRFVYGPTTGYGAATPDDVAVATVGADDPFDPATTAASVVKTVGGLQPSTTYHYKLIADNGTGAPAETSDGTFTTAPPVPEPTTGAVTNLTPTTATVSGSVDTHGLAGTATFVVAQTDGSYAKSADVVLDAADGPRAVKADLSGLPSAAAFEVRLTITTAGGQRFGDLVSFATPAKPTYVPPAPPPATGSSYGCDAPHIDAYNKVAQPGQAITLTGTDLGTGGTVAIGDAPAAVASYSSTAITAIVPDATTGSVVVTVNCGKVSNAIGLVTPGSSAFTQSATVKATAATFKVAVLGAGKVAISGSRLTTARKSVTKAGTATVTVRLTKAGRRALAASKSRTLRVTAKVSFTPTGGTAATATRTLTFKRGGTR